MICPNCGAPMAVDNSRDAGRDTRTRKYRCTAGHRHTGVEVLLPETHTDRRQARGVHPRVLLALDLIDEVSTIALLDLLRQRIAGDAA